MTTRTQLDDDRFVRSTDHLPSARPPRRRWPFVLAAVLVLGLLAGATYVVAFTPVLGLRTIVVSGVGDDLSGQVRGAVAEADGTPLIRIDLAAAERRVAALPQIASATVTRQWPNNLVVQATPRTPVAATSANGTLWLLDSSGHAYQRVATAPAGLVTVELATPGPDDPSTKAALVVVDSMTAQFRTTVAAVRAPSPYQISVLLRDKRTVVWGGDDDGARKMQILPALLQQPGTVFDISVPTLVTVR